MNWLYMAGLLSLNRTRKWFPLKLVNQPYQQLPWDFITCTGALVEKSTTTIAKKGMNTPKVIEDIDIYIHISHEFISGSALLINISLWGTVLLMSRVWLFSLPKLKAAVNMYWQVCAKMAVDKYAAVECVTSNTMGQVYWFYIWNACYIFEMRVIYLRCVLKPSIN